MAMPSMAMSRKAGCWLGILGLWLTGQSAQAFGDSFLPHGKLGPRICTWVENYHIRRVAPWYTYFPDGSHTMGPSSGLMYPTWPSSFPPPQSPWAEQHTMFPSGYDAPSIYSGYPAGPGYPSGQTAGYAPAPVYQPAGNYPMSTPSYWFAR